MTALLIQVNETDQGGADDMIGLINQGLLQVLLERLYIEVIYDLGEDSQCVCLTHLVLVLPDILGQLADNYKYLPLASLQLLLYHIGE